MTTITKTKTCPTWCDWQHHGSELNASYDGHSGTVLGQATGDDFACVALEQVGDQPVRICLEVPDDMTVSLEEAVKVAAALLEAVRLAGVPTMTVREAAIANGWDPADGSPWVGPDGVTYPSKDAFYEAAQVTR